jgi:hypothetical protein
LLIFCCLGTSHRTWYEKYGPNGSWTKAAAGTPLISTFFKPEKNENAASDVPPEQMGLTDFELSDDDQNEQQSQRVWDNAHVAEKALELRERLLDKNNLSAKDYLQFRAIYEYLVRLKAGGKGKMKASQEAASIVYMDAGPAQACKIRFLSTFWIENSTLPPSHQGKFQKTVRLIDDEGIAEACKAWIRCPEHCNYSWDELPDMVDLALDTVSLETIRRFARKSFRYMNLYRANVTGKLAEYACKKFKSHRRVPQDKLEHFLSQFQ